MPYVDQDTRKKFDDIVNHLVATFKTTAPKAGNLNYVITCLLNAFYDVDRYEGFNSAVGVLECVKLELYRRRVAPYEDQAMVKNGDIPAYKR